jgi:hypothetical protein
VTKVRLYFDDDSSDGDVLRALRRASINAETTFSLGTYGRPDAAHLDIAASADRVVVTANESDFARLHREWLSAGRHHSGILNIHQQRWSVGEQIRRIRLFVQQRSAEEMLDWIEYLSHFS